MKTKNKHRLSGFTILEVTITMVITAILITLVYSAINFLAKQNHDELKTKNEINNWLVMRQQIMYDVYTSFSLEEIPSGILLKKPNEIISYYEEDGRFLISKNGNIITTKYENVSFEWTAGEKDDKSYCELVIPVKREPMKLHFLTFSDNSNRINKWFKTEVIDGRN